MACKPGRGGAGSVSSSVQHTSVAGERNVEDWRRIGVKEGAVEGQRKERRGFASMSPEKQKEIASKGGRAAHEKGTAHEWTPDEARAAGRKGGQSSRGGRGRLPVSPRDVHNLGNAPGTIRSPGRAD